MTVGSVAITPGSGETVVMDDRTIGAVTGGIQVQYDIGASAVAVGTASVTTASASAVSARDSRKRVVLRALPTNTDYLDVGPSGVAAGSGFRLYPGESVTLYTTAAIHADANSGTQTLCYLEEYNT